MNAHQAGICGQDITDHRHQPASSAPRKPLFVAVDGPDGAGKSTLIPLLRRAVHHKAHVIERWLGSCWVYDRLAGEDEAAGEANHATAAVRRDTDVWDELKAMQAIYDVRQIVLIPTLSELKRRDPLSTTEFLGRSIDAFESWLVESRLRIPTFAWCGDGTIADIVEKAAKWLLEPAPGFKP